MNIVVTGSLGNVSKPLTQLLIQKGHAVTVISSKVERSEAIEALGAKAAIGTMEDAHFLTNIFKGADVVYLMESLVGGPQAFFDPNVDVIETITAIGGNYKQAVEASGVKHVVLLSSIGAHTNNGTGLIKMHYNVEQILNSLPGDVAIKVVRPVGFYTVLFGFIPTIKAQGGIVQNYGGNEQEPWVSPLDIAAAIAEEIERPFSGREVRYIASDEASPNEVARLLGEAIGKPDLQWLTISDDEFLNGMKAAGMTPKTAEQYAEMNRSRFGGEMYKDYYCHKPVLGSVKLKDFAAEFAAAYHQS